MRTALFERVEVAADERSALFAGADSILKARMLPSVVLTRGFDASVSVVPQG